MPSTTCGWCHRWANMTRTADAIVVSGAHYGGYVSVMAPFSCDYCHKLSLAYSSTERHNVDSVDVDDWLASVDEHLHWLPRVGVGKEYPDVPEQVASTASEAHECLSIGVARGAVALARAVVETAAKDKGFTVGDLYKKIDALAEAGHIREDVREAAHEVRLDGNEVAHGDLVAQPISIDEARDVLDLLDQLLHDVYQAPARVARVRANRLARKRPPDE